MRQHPDRTAERNQIPWIGGKISDTGDQALQIIHRIQILPQLLPRDHAAFQLADRILTPADLLPVNQRLFHIRAQEPGPHRGLCLIEHPEQGTTLVLLSQRLRQLQVPPRGAVDNHISAGRIRVNRTDLPETVFLCLIEIF